MWYVDSVLEKWKTENAITDSEFTVMFYVNAHFYSITSESLI